MELRTREAWGALPSKGTSGNWSTGWGDFLVVHYTGISARPDPVGFDAKAAYLRELQSYYQSGAHPGGPYVDVGYNFAIFNDDEQAVWELRGLRMKGGANGNGPSNSIRPSVLIVSDVGETPHSALRAKVAWLVDMIRAASGKQTGTRGHRDEFPTSCPGDPLYDMVRSGAFLPENQGGGVPLPPPVPGDNGDMTPYVVTVEGTRATFIGQGYVSPATGRLLILELEWVNGNDPLELARFQAIQGDLAKAHIGLDGCRNATVDRVPVGDGAYTWTRQNFGHVRALDAAGSTTCNCGAQLATLDAKIDATAARIPTKTATVYVP